MKSDVSFRYNSFCSNADDWVALPLILQFVQPNLIVVHLG